MVPIFVHSLDNYDSAPLEEAVRQQLSALLPDKLEGKRIVLKPNLLMRRSPERATTTHPEVVRAVVHILKERGATDIVVADSPGGPYTKGLLHGIYSESGMAAVAKEEGISLNEDTSSVTIPSKEHHLVPSFTLIRPVVEADLIINLVKLKTHCMMGLSGAVKNLFGTIPGLAKPEFHMRFPDKDDFGDMLLDLCGTVSPAVTLVDAIVSMEGDGPSGGSPVNTGLLLGSNDPFTLDFYITKLMGLDPDTIPTVKRAAERGMVQPYEIIGESKKSIHLRPARSIGVDFGERIPPFLRGIMKSFTPRPVVIAKKCIGCGKCKESCPADRITITDHKAKIDPNKCIRCYCCHEMCPVTAIKVKRAGVWRF